MSDFIIVDTSEGIDEEQKKQTIISKIDLWLLGRQKIKLKLKVIFYRLLATMVDTGISIVKSVQILEHDNKNKLYKQTLRNIVRTLKGGKSLSQALEQFPRSFTEMEIAIIQSGEKTGELNKALLQLADQMEEAEGIARKIKGAMIYPAAIVITMIVTVLVVMVKVIPKMTELFGDAENLPGSTKLLIQVSDFSLAYWWLFPIVLLGGIVAMKMVRRSVGGKYRTDAMMIKIPGIGSLAQKIIVSRFSHTLAALLRNGISVVEALKVLSSVVGNEVYRQRVLLLKEDVRKGIRMADSLEGDKLFPEVLVQMIRIGEETAKIDITVEKLANLYDEEVDQAVTNINKIIEPVIIILLAVIVGGMAFAIMEPIFALAEQIQ